MAGWTQTTLGEVGEWGSGGTPLSSKPEYYGGAIPWLIIEDLNDDFVFRSQRTITEAGLKNSSARLLEPQTLLIAMYGSIGKLGITGVSCATNQAIAFCKPNNKQADIKFLFYYLLRSRSKLTGEGRGGTQQNISQAILKDFPIALPPIEEQKRIASILDKADRLRRARRYAQQLSDTFIQSVFVEMFGDPAANSRGWDAGTIDDVLLMSQYGTSNKSNSEGLGYPVLSMGNLSYSGAIDLSSISYVELPYEEFMLLRLVPGDVIFNRTNSTELVGKTAHWTYSMDAVLASYLVKLKLNKKVLPDYFVALLNTPYYKQLFQRRCKKAVGQSNISPTLLREFPVLIPPRPLQEKFARVVQRCERLRAQQREATRQAEHLFQTLLHRAFRGEL